MKQIWQKKAKKRNIGDVFTLLQSQELVQISGFSFQCHIQNVQKKVDSNNWLRHEMPLAVFKRMQAQGNKLSSEVSCVFELTMSTSSRSLKPSHRALRGPSFL